MLEYATDLFDRGSVEALGARLVRLLQGVVGGRRPRARQSGDTERFGAASDPGYGSGTTRRIRSRRDAAGTVFGAGVAHAGGGCGGVRGRRALSYAALEAQANQLAHHLRGLGVGPESVVGLCVERSPEMVVGLLGSSRRAAPICRSIPATRPSASAFMLEDAGAPVLVTLVGPGWSLRLPAQAAAARIVRLDSRLQDIARQPATAPPHALDPHNPAYVIYTSGSTGTAKRRRRHTCRAAGTSLSAMQKQIPLDRDDRLLAVTTIGFDIAVLELFLPLINGASVAIAAKEDKVPGSASACTNGRQDRGHDPAGYFNAVADAYEQWRQGLQDEDHLKDLRMLVGGEPLTSNLARALRTQDRRSASLRADGDHDLVERDSPR